MCCRVLSLATHPEKASLAHCHRPLPEADQIVRRWPDDGLRAFFILSLLVPFPPLQEEKKTW